MKKPFLFIFILFASAILYAQNTATIKGTVVDAKTKETMVGVNIVVDDTTGVSTDVFGNFMLNLTHGKHKLEFRFIGYSSDIRQIIIAKGTETRKLIVELVPEQKILNEVVVSAGRHEQNMAEVTVSMGLIKPKLLENNNTRNIETALDKMPGVSMMEGQVSIRGGSGFSYGAASRVLLMINDLPILAGASGQVKWWATPLENIEQIEIIKGASSALFGSSALNGTINIRTAWPGAIPQTQITFYSGFYGKAEREVLNWKKGAQPNFSGIQFSHSQRMGNFDIVLGMNGHTDAGYRMNDSRQRVGMNINTRYRSKKFEGLNYGINVNGAYRVSEPYIIWRNAPDSVYYSTIGFNSVNKNTAINFDPYITYYKGNTKHSLKGRYFYIKNETRAGINNDETLFYGEYQLQKTYDKGLTWSSGASFSRGMTISEIYGKSKRATNSSSLFTQLDQKYKNWTFSLGGRLELYNFNDDVDIVDSLVGDTKKLAKFFENVKPVFRSGINYKLFKYTHLRASFGQGYRYPTIAEKYLHASEGGVNLFPNDSLKAETGWSGEIGLMQGFKISDWKGYVDIAGFWTEYKNMIEFEFGTFFPAVMPDTLNNTNLPTFISDHVGFQARNVTLARITGIDATISGTGKIYKFPVTFLAGYTYTVPINMAAADSIKGTEAEVLKYRNYHTAKVDVEIGFKKISLGMSYNYFSKIVNIDEAYQDTIFIRIGTTNINTKKVILPGLKEYRKDHNGPQHVFDFRISMNLGAGSRLSFVVKNAFNKEYMVRPGDVQAPRNYSIQYILKL